MVTTINLKYFLILLLFITPQTNTFKLFDLFNFNGKSTSKEVENSPIVQIELLNGTEETTTITTSTEDELLLTTEIISNDVSHNESTVGENFDYNSQEAVTNSSDYSTINLTHPTTNISDIDTSSGDSNDNTTISENMSSNETITPTINEEHFFEINENTSNLTSTITTIDTNESSGQQYEIVTQCHPTQFTCISNNECIDRTKVCNQISDCPDSSDESSEHGHCDEGKPFLSTEKKYLDILAGNIIEIHVSIHRTPTSYTANWLKDNYNIEENNRVYKDIQSSHYHTQKDYTLRIEGATSGDSGLYKFVINYDDDKSVELEIPVRIYGFEQISKEVVRDENILNDNFKKCPEGEKACKSGHCLSLSLFCDRHINCPDGDDEVNCGEVICNSDEFSCDNICIEREKVCDGIRNCLDGEDEANCPGFEKQQDHSVRPTYPPSNTQHAHITVTCPDGSIPEYSLHGSTYCWSNSVCPSGTLCTEGKCCHNANADALRHCNFDEWECGDGRCLDWSNRCNGVVECSDKSDEMHCDIIIPQPQNGKRSLYKIVDDDNSDTLTNSNCQENEYECKNKQCIPLEKRCNHNYDCSDGSDETTCEYFLNAQKYHNKNNNNNINNNNNNNNQHTGEQDNIEPFEIIAHQPNHDYSRENKQYSDEVCADDEFKCVGLDYLYCIYYDKICDGVDDCGNGADERNCTKTPEATKVTEEGGCKDGEFKCINNNKCIPSSLKCDRKYDCEDGSDETTCDYFKQASQRHHQHQHHNQHHHHNQQQQQTTTTSTTTTIITTPATQPQRIVEQQRHPAISRQEYEEQERQRLLQEAEYNRRLEEYHRSQTAETPETIRTPKPLPEVTFKDEYDREFENDLTANEDDFETDDDIGTCQPNEYMCQHSRECIDKKALCDGISDCLDQSDELYCQDKGKKFTTIHSKTDGRHDERKDEHHIHGHIDETQRYHEREQQRRVEETQRHHEREQQRRVEETHRHHDREQQRRIEETQRHHEREQQRRLEEAQRHQEREQQRRLEEAQRYHEREQQQRAEETQRELEREQQRRLEEAQRHQEREQQRRLEETQRHHEREQQRRVEEAQRQLEREQERHIEEIPREQEQSTEEIPRTQHYTPTPQPYHHRQHIKNHQLQQSVAEQEIHISVYPPEIVSRDGKEASFECRARTFDNAYYPEVKWTRVGGPLPSTAWESSGRLTFNPLSVEDSGRYVCVATHDGKRVEAYVNLHVQHYGPQALHTEYNTPFPQRGTCSNNEIKCGNNDCVKNEYVCDGEPDCGDRADEANCPSTKVCEPNEFKCANDRCVQKMWLCDGDDDCGDGSDELNCKKKNPGDLCEPTEFKCADNRQCVPQSFQCDGTNDCQDGSDEVGCVQPTVVQPPETNKQVPQGSTFSLSCRAVAVPEPYINWRLNWGPVCEPPRCLQHSEGGVGTLTIHNAQPLDQGAYTCEAINVKGRVLATPDCIVRIVNIPAPQPPPALPRHHCDPVGSATTFADPHTGTCQCKPLVTGPSCNQCKPGSYHLTEKSSHGCLKCFCFGITDQCTSSRLYRTKSYSECEKLLFDGDSEGVILTDSRGIQVYNENNFDFGRQGYLTHYESDQGHEIKYWKLPQRFLGDKVTAYGGTFVTHLQYTGHGHPINEPVIILKGNRITLVHKLKPGVHIRPNEPNIIEVETYESNYEHETGQPASREDLMMVLADLDHVLIRATHAYGQESTSLGDVNWDIAVDRDTQGEFALEVEQCRCPPGYMGTSCEDCAPGYERSHTGPYLGTCVPAAPRAPTCSPGAVSQHSQHTGYCQCKPQTTGQRCDQCSAHSFYLSPANPQGCIPCFCSGVTNQCSSSSLRRNSVKIDYTHRDMDDLQITSRDTVNALVPESAALIEHGSITFSSFHEARGQTLYWKLPEKFLGDKVTSYGGSLRYTFKFNCRGSPNMEPDVVIKGNGITLQHYARQQFHPNRENTIDVKIFEDRWSRVDDQVATREHLLMALANLDEVLIKMTHMAECTESSLISVSLDYADSYGPGAPALEVEQCICPPGYIGTSCENCAPGYTRSGGGLYLGICERCECHGHATECDKEHGICLNCQHNTEGDNCERCKPGFVGDARRGTPMDCQPEQAKPPCECHNHSPRGCDSYGRCLFCEHNTEGFHCETCKKGFYGNATNGTPYDCNLCPCPGASDCYIGPNGQVQCRNCPAGYYGPLCNECAPGYTRSQKSGGRDCEPIGRIHEDRIEFVPSQEGLRVEIEEPKFLQLTQGQRVKWNCRVIEPAPQNVVITWSKVGSMYLPQSAQQVGNKLIIENVEPEDAGQYRCTGQSGHKIATDEANLIVIRGEPPRPVVTPPEQTANEGESATFTCTVPGLANCEVRWHKEDVGGPLPHGVYPHGGTLRIPHVQPHHAGNYICTAVNQYGLGQSNPGKLNVVKHKVPPRVDPPVLNVDEGEPARFRCWVPGNARAVLKWTLADGSPLPQGAEENNGYLNIYRTIKGVHDTNYLCTATDPNTPYEAPEPAPLARLNINEPHEPIKPVIDPIEQTVPEGTSAKFRCWVPNHPEINVRWTQRNGAPIPQSAMDSRGELIWRQAHTTDAGDYICTAFDPVSRQNIPSDPATLNVVAKVIPQEAPRMENPIVDPVDQKVKVGDPARIKCYVPGTPNAHLRWQKADGQPLPQGVYEDGRGLLYIYKVEKSHENEYVCLAQDPNTGERKESEKAKINVDEPVEGKPPIPTASPPLLTVKEGEPATFECEAESDTPVQFTWGYIHESGRLPEGVHAEGQKLNIRNAGEHNVGDYICIATNEFGKGVAPPVKLEITEESTPPTARVEPRVWNGKPGDMHKFKCIVTGSPTPTIHWTGPNGEELPEGTEVQDNGVYLVFESAKTDYNGEYTCTAKNDVGEASDTGIVNIGSPLIVRTNPPGPRIVLTVGEPLEIRCEAFGEPEPEVEWLHDPGPERGDLPDDYVPVTISEQFIKHPGVGLGNSGRYTCKGSNQIATASKDIYIEVVEPSQVATVAILGGSTQYLAHGQQARIVCTSTGSNLVDKIKWTNIHTGEEVESNGDEGVLFIDAFDDHLVGEYKCIGYRNDREIASAKVHLKPDSERSVDAIQVEIAPPNVRVVRQGESVILECVMHGDNNGKMKYKWSQLRRGSLVPNIKQTSQLVIKSADSTQDHGVYRCEVLDEDGELLGSAYTAVSVGHTSDEQASIYPLEEESDAEIECPIFIVPGSHVEWSKQDESELPDNVHVQGTKLKFTNFEEENSGIYICKVTMENNNEVEGYAKVQIYVPDTVIQVRIEQSTDNPTLGDRIWFDCIVTGDNTATFEWSKEESDHLPEGTHVEKGRLVFNELTKEDSGTYWCQALTKDGMLRSKAVLNIGEIPGKRKRKHLNPKNKSKRNYSSHNTRPVAKMLKHDHKINKNHYNNKDTSNKMHATFTETHRKSTNHHTANDYKHNNLKTGEINVIIQKGNNNQYNVNKNYPYDNKYKNIDDKTKDDMVFEVKPQGIVRPAGTNVQLYCGDNGYSIIDKKKSTKKNVKWRKVHDIMPFSYKIDNNGILSINNVKIKDSGLYECIEQKLDGTINPSKYVLLTVTQLVPRFDGKSYLLLQPITPEQWRDLSMNITVKPSIKDGIILYVEKNSGQYSNPENYHEIKLKNGKVVYDYDIGNGKFNITSNKEIQLNEWSTITIKNDENMATLLVNNENEITSENDGQKIYENIPSSSLYIGGKEIPRGKVMSDEMVDDNNYFVGSISQITVSNKTFDIGSNVVRVHGTVQQSKICSPNPCRNNGQCHTANVLTGFICHCREGYMGDYCEVKNNICNGNLTCQEGICSIVNNKEQCICPYGKKGENCQEEDTKFLDSYVKSVEFNGRTSFIKIPIKNIDDSYKIQMNIKFSNLDENQMIAHISNSGKEKNKEYINIGVEDNKFSAIQSTKTSKKKKIDKTRLINDDVHKIEITKDNDKKIVTIDGKIIVIGKIDDLKNEISSAEESNGYLIIGQIPPGLSRFSLKTLSEIDNSNLEATQNVPYGFNGCLINITLNGKYILTSDIINYNSGDIKKCETKKDSGLLDISFQENNYTILKENNNKDGYIKKILTTINTFTTEITLDEIKDEADYNNNISTTSLYDTYSPITTGNNYRLPQSGETEDSIEKGMTTEVGEKEHEEIVDNFITSTISYDKPSMIDDILISKEKGEMINDTTTIDNITTMSSFEEKKSSEVGITLPTDSSSLEDNYISNESYQISSLEEDKSSLKTTPAFDIDMDDESLTEVPQNVQIIDRCEFDTCGDNGICEEVNSTHIACSCKISYDGPRCDIFKPIEYAAKFNGKAFIVFSPEEFPHLTSEQIEVIELRIKTTHKYGVLLWQSSTYTSSEYPTDYISLGINDGFLVFSYELGGGAARITSRDIISDGEEHYIRIVRKGRSGNIYIDNLPVVKGESSGILAMLNADSYIYLGGLPKPNEMSGGVHSENFVGCIAELYFNSNKIGLMENAIDGQNVLPCSEWPSPYVRKRWFKNRKYKNV